MIKPSEDAVDVRPLADTIIALAGTPDDVPGIDAQLESLARLAADRVHAADYASVVVLADDTGSTVAVGGDLAGAVDSAQDSTDGTAPADASTATMKWPKFEEAAAGLGLQASASIPVFIGSGKKIASLNLYGRDAAAMAPLIMGAWAVRQPDGPLPGERDDLPALDSGAEELLTGFAEALAVRSTIQLAVSIVMGREHLTARDAYLRLRLRAAETGTALLDIAGAVIVKG